MFACLCAASPVKRRLDLTPATAPATATGGETPSAARLLKLQGASGTLILSDFDKSLTDCDAGELDCIVPLEP